MIDKKEIGVRWKRTNPDGQIIGDHAALIVGLILSVGFITPLSYSPPSR